MKTYPRFACIACGKKHGTRLTRVEWLYGKCEVCGKNANVTDPKDYGHFQNWFAGEGGK
jgi:hypothetical protein